MPGRVVERPVCPQAQTNIYLNCESDGVRIKNHRIYQGEGGRSRTHGGGAARGLGSSPHGAFRAGKGAAEAELGHLEGNIDGGEVPHQDGRKQERRVRGLQPNFGCGQADEPRVARSHREV